MILTALNFVTDVIIIVFAIWVGAQYFRIKNWILVKIKNRMDLDKIISDTLETEIEKKEPDTLVSVLISSSTLPNQHAYVEGLRERLISVAFAGKSKEFLGKNITSEEIRTSRSRSYTKTVREVRNSHGRTCHEVSKKAFYFGLY